MFVLERHTSGIYKVSEVIAAIWEQMQVLLRLSLPFTVWKAAVCRLVAAPTRCQFFAHLAYRLLIQMRWRTCACTLLHAAQHVPPLQAEQHNTSFYHITHTPLTCNAPLFVKCNLLVAFSAFYLKHAALLAGHAAKLAGWWQLLYEHIVHVSAF
jgi:hypothetical protein